MRRRFLLAAAGAAAAVAVPASPALAIPGDAGGGVTIEEFVCFGSIGDRIFLGRALAITLPNGRVVITPCIPGSL